MEVAAKNVLQREKTALNDLEEYEAINRSYPVKLKNLKSEIEKLMAQKQILAADIDKQKASVTYYESQYIDLTSKIENTSVSQNKATLVASSNADKIKQVEAKVAANKISLDFSGIAEVEMPQRASLKAQSERLLFQKGQLENRIAQNETKIKNTLEGVKN